MNFPQFWARATSRDLVVWRWSSNSFAEAQSLADEAIKQLAATFRVNNRPQHHTGYYPNRPFREQILQEIKDTDGQVAAVVTRNSYGCRVLNTARVMFVDIDIPEPKPPGLFKRLFGKPDAAPATNPQADAIAKVERWTRDNSKWGWRIYKTRAGLRLLATQELVDADSDVARGVFAALGADPLYQALCQSQKCFRARLTPKPWRCGLREKPERWPWLDAKAEHRFQKWDAKYQSSSNERATCELVRHIGNTSIHPGVEPIIKLHDEATRIASKLSLA